uniref:Uncharacterized protein n=1 Tax=Diddensiella santjacobensis TaxID=2704139 RepID=S5TFA8_9ASCO|nr:hypothetical protein [Diddensiella santjacobensis]AGS44137.1 hypothetical protein [Diddensiella santjacobensis]
MVFQILKFWRFLIFWHFYIQNMTYLLWGFEVLKASFTIFQIFEIFRVLHTKCYIFLDIYIQNMKILRYHILLYSIPIIYMYIISSKYFLYIHTYCIYSIKYAYYKYYVYYV